VTSENWLEYDADGGIVKGILTIVNKRVWWTDRHTDTGRQQLQRLRITSRGKSWITALSDADKKFYYTHAFVYKMIDGRTEIHIHYSWRRKQRILRLGYASLYRGRYVGL